MLMCFWRGRSMPAIRAIVLNLSWLLALSFWLLAKAKSPRPKAVSALALFVFRVDADHPHHTLAVDDLALVTNFLYRCSYFHKLSSQLSAFSRQQNPLRPIYNDKQFFRDSNRRAKAPPRLCHREGCE